MRLGVTIAILAGVAVLLPAPVRAQAQDVPPNASAPASQSGRATEQAAPSEPTASVSVQTGAPSAGAQAVAPLAPRVDNTAYRPAPEGAANK
jgi:uncharacterized protein YggE